MAARRMHLTAFWSVGEAVATSSRAEYYTQNAICRQSSCVNPIFPGLDDLPRLEQVMWQCSEHGTVSSYVSFCKGIVNYNPALPSLNVTRETVDSIIERQDAAAATMFFYHLSGLGYEAGEHRNPGTSADECVKSVWKLVCFTYFPKAEAGRKAGEVSPYLRPCRDCCERYLEACGVECCDESVQCVFGQQQQAGNQPADGALVQSGYVDALGPSALCTGSGSRRVGLPAMLLLLGILAAHLGIGDCCSGGTWFVSSVQGRHQQQRQLWSVRLFSLVVLSVAVLLQGCEVDLPHHSIGNWRKQPDYLVAYEFVPPDKSPSTAVLNSCSDQDIPDSLRCSGQGYCKEWSLDASWKAEVSFCECNRDWADPECRTQRKSQIVVFLCSLFGGFLGLDYLYLGIPILAFLKLVTLGGLGFWWLLDIVRTGSGPVYAHNYRVASDLPHWAFVLSTVTIFSLAGFYAAIHSYLSFRKRKREDLMKLQESEEIRHLAKMEPILESPSWHGGRFGGAAATPWRSSLPPPGWEFGGYGATLQGPPPPQRGAHCAGLGGWVHAGGM